MKDSISTTVTFMEACKVIDLAKEYSGATPYSGKERYAIVTDLTESELNANYSTDLAPYRPYVLLSPEMYEVIKESHRNDSRETKRDFLYHDSFALDDERVPIAPHSDPASIAESDDTYKHIINEMLKLPGRQGHRMYQHYVLGFSLEEIARKEGVSAVAVFRSIERAKKAMHKVFVESGVSV